MTTDAGAKRIFSAWDMLPAREAPAFRWSDPDDIVRAFTVYANWLWWSERTLGGWKPKGFRPDLKFLAMANPPERVRLVPPRAALVAEFIGMALEQFRLTPETIPEWLELADGVVTLIDAPGSWPTDAEISSLARMIYNERMRRLQETRRFGGGDRPIPGLGVIVRSKPRPDDKFRSWGTGLSGKGLNDGRGRPLSRETIEVLEAVLAKFQEEPDLDQKDLIRAIVTRAMAAHRSSSLASVRPLTYWISSEVEDEDRPEFVRRFMRRLTFLQMKAYSAWYKWEKDRGDSRVGSLLTTLGLVGE